MSATSRASRLGDGCIGLRKFGGAESPMVEVSQSFNDIPARRAAASARSRTDGSIPSTLHDTREFMLPSGSADPALHLAPSAFPRVPLKRKSNLARVVCLSSRLFRVTVKNGLRNRPAGPESCFGVRNWAVRAFSSEVDAGSR